MTGNAEKRAPAAMGGTASHIVGIAGGSGSGKTTFARALLGRLGPERCEILGQDRYYIDQSHRFDRDGGSVNFDHPSAIDFDLMATHLARLRAGRSIQVPSYDFRTHTRLPVAEAMVPKPVVLVDGILILSQPRVRRQFDESVFLECPEEVRFQRRLQRDMTERGRTEEGVRAQFFQQVKPMHDAFVEPSKQFADYRIADEAAFARVLDELSQRLLMRG